MCQNPCRKVPIGTLWSGFPRFWGDRLTALSRCVPLRPSVSCANLGANLVIAQLDGPPLAKQPLAMCCARRRCSLVVPPPSGGGCTRSPAPDRPASRDRADPTLAGQGAPAHLYRLRPGRQPEPGTVTLGKLAQPSPCLSCNRCDRRARSVPPPHHSVTDSPAGFVRNGHGTPNRRPEMAWHAFDGWGRWRHRAEDAQ